jgi:hypothetical protein
MESRNRVGGAYSLTVIAPILPGHEDELRTHIESLPIGPDSPLARLDTLHFSRLQIFSELVYQGPPQRPDHLNGSHLVFTSTFDGELDPYLDAICERLGPEADAWWRHCAGYPGTADRPAFKRYIRRHQVDSALFASAHPEASVADVLGSMALRRRVLDFASAAQGLDAGELQRRFRETFAEPR